MINKKSIRRLAYKFRKKKTDLRHSIIITRQDIYISGIKPTNLKGKDDKNNLTKKS